MITFQPQTEEIRRLRRLRRLPTRRSRVLRRAERRSEGEPRDVQLSVRSGDDSGRRFRPRPRRRLPFRKVARLVGHVPARSGWCGAKIF